MHNLHVRILSAFLILLGGALCYYKVSILGLPLFPTEEADVWTVEARLEFKAREDLPVKVQLAIPRKPDGYTVVDEGYVSGKYGVMTEDDGLRRYALWSVRNTKGYQVLYYRIQLAPNLTAVNDVDDVASDAPPQALASPEFPEVMRPAIKDVLEESKRKSADSLSYAREILARLNSKNPDANVDLIKQDVQTADDWVGRAVDVLTDGGITARVVHLLILRDGVKHGDLTPWIQIHDGHQWQLLDPGTGDPGTPHNSVMWSVGNAPVLDVQGGRRVKIEYSVSRQTQEMTLVAEKRANQLGSRIIEFSLFSLPVQAQNVYRVLMLVPLGAFLIVILRNVVGINTFGTFMPVLIALAFRETKLQWGIVLFILVIFLGLVIRFYLEYLKLLLVPRLAAVVTIVIILMATISVFTHKLGMDRGVSVALFPMVIMAMTIERMSLVWDELGPWTAIQQGVGSLAVAAIAYLIMSSKVLGHLVFVFPESLLILLGAILLLGRYTGYRLTELWRFRSALKG